MKQSDLEVLQWDGRNKRYTYDCDGQKMTAVISHNGDVWVHEGMWKPGEVRDLARITEHYDATRRFAPDEERPTREQVERWLRETAKWVNRVGTNFWCRFARPLDAIYIDSESSRALAAIAYLEKRDEAELAREMMG